MPKSVANLKAHAARIIEKKKLADGAISFLCRCCDDPSTDSWHTIHFTHHEDLAAAMRGNPPNQGQSIMSPAQATEAFIRGELDAHKARVAKLHDIDVSVHQIAESFVEGK